MVHRYNWRGVDARNAFERALGVSPNDPEVLVNYGYFLANIGQHEKAIKLAERAVELDPYNSETPRLNSLVLSQLLDHPDD